MSELEPLNDFNELAPVVWKLWPWWIVFLSTSRRENEWSGLEQRINIAFCVKVRENTSDTCPLVSEV